MDFFFNEFFNNLQLWTADGHNGQNGRHVVQIVVSGDVEAVHNQHQVVVGICVKDVQGNHNHVVQRVKQVILFSFN